MAHGCSSTQLPRASSCPSTFTTSRLSTCGISENKILSWIGATVGAVCLRCLTLVGELQQLHRLHVCKQLAQRWHATVRRRILRCSARSIQNAGSHRYAHGASIHTYASVHTQPLLQAHRSQLAQCSRNLRGDTGRSHAIRRDPKGGCNM